jgi:NAD(P)-dependent dehydrogenase (short-subunit alcohol dehydrogenase family)
MPETGAGVVFANEVVTMSGHATAAKLAGKTAVVTGAARGLGRAFALRLGAEVAIVDIRLDAAREYGETLTEESVPAEIERLGRRSPGDPGGPCAA